MMNKELGPYHVVDLPSARRILLNAIDLSLQHCMYGLLEVDVTAARQILEAYKARTGERISFTGYLARCLAQAVEEDKMVQAYLKGRKQLVVFDDVDVGLMIERQNGGTRAPEGFVIRRANHKTLMEIHREIRAAQAGPGLRRDEMPSWLQMMEVLPGPLLKLVNVLVRMAKRRDPAGMWVAMAGTVGITSVGMFGHGGGWGFSAPAGHTLCLYAGGIARKPVAVQDRVELREMLSLAVVFDHDVVDGAPAARFVKRLVELVESGYGLDEIRTSGAMDTEPAAAQPARALA